MYVRDFRALERLLRCYELHMAGRDDSGADVQTAIELHQMVTRERERLQGRAASLTAQRNPAIAQALSERMSA